MFVGRFETFDDLDDSRLVTNSKFQIPNSQRPIP
jgi:hypothetical protein